MDVSVIYVNYNSSDEIIGSIDTLYKWTAGLEFEIIVVDNDSKEDFSILERDDIHLVKNNRNAGFGAGCNLGAKCARGDFLLFLNPDTLLLSDVLNCLVTFLKERPEAGGAGPMVLEEDGSIHYGAARSFPSLTNEFLEHSTITFKYPDGKFTGRPYLSFWDHKSTKPVDTLIGACMMFRREIFDSLGGFDEQFFLFYEEVDLCRRTWDSGKQIWYVHSCGILHEGHTSVAREYGSVSSVTGIYFESAEKYFKKHFGKLYALTWRVMISCLYLARYIRRRRPFLWANFKWGIGFVQYNNTNIQ